MIFKKVTFHIVIICATFSIFAQESINDSKTKFSIETDPATFVFNGYAGHLRIKPKTSKHLVLGAGVYAIDLPEIMVNMNKNNKDESWNVRINSAFGLFGEYYLKNAGQKWFIGLQTSIQNYKISNDHVPNYFSKYSNILIMPSLGYMWHPFKFPIYIKPWTGLGYSSKISGNNTLEGQKYHIASLVPFATVHLGYTF